MALSGTEKKQEQKGEDKLKIHEEKKGTESLARPLRIRKGVERFLIEDGPRRSAPRKIVVFQGNGTPLKDIPNVAFKLSKRKTDNNLVLLHIILFGKKAKVPMVKKNLSLFSGFLWIEEEEKQRSKVRKKLDQCVKAKLLDFCNILDIPVNKATIKKEDLSAILLKFLESPHPTTEALLADQEKTRKLKQNSPVGAKQKHSKDEEDDKKCESSIGKDHPQKNSEDSDGDGEDEQAPHLVKRTAVEKIYLKTCGNSKARVNGHSEKSLKNTSRKRSSCSSSEAESKIFVVKKPKVEKKCNNISEAESKGKSSSVKKLNEPKERNKVKCNNISEADSKGKSSSVKKLNVRKERNKVQKASVTKTSSKPSSKSSAKTKIVKQGKTPKTESEIPGEEMQIVLAGILKKVDLNTTTLAYILGQLGAHFNMDLSHRKPEVKALIGDIISKMMDEDREPDTGNAIDNEDDNDTYYA